MTKESRYEEIKDIFNNIACCEMDFEKLSILTCEDFAAEVLDIFEHSKKRNRFKAQTIKETYLDHFNNSLESIVISLGDSYGTDHFTFYQTLNGPQWFRIFIQQDFFEHIVKPFHEDLNRKVGDSLIRRLPKSID